MSLTLKIHDYKMKTLLAVSLFLLVSIGGASILYFSYIQQKKYVISSIKDLVTGNAKWIYTELCDFLLYPFKATQSVNIFFSENKQFTDELQRNRITLQLLGLLNAVRPIRSFQIALENGDQLVLEEKEFSKSKKKNFIAEEYPTPMVMDSLFNEPSEKVLKSNEKKDAPMSKFTFNTKQERQAEPVSTFAFDTSEEITYISTYTENQQNSGLDNVIEEIYNSSGRIVSSKRYTIPSSYNILDTSRKLNQKDPRQSSWYLGAKRKLGSFWSTPSEVSSDLNNLNITVSYPLIDEKGNFKGAVCAYIPIYEFVHLIRTKLTARDLLVCCLFDDKGTVIAYPNISEIYQLDDTGKLQKNTIQQLTLHNFDKIYANYVQEGLPKKMLFNNDGHKEYKEIGFFFKLPEYLQTKWTLGIVFFEDVLKKRIQHTLPSRFLILLIFLVICTVYIWIIAKKIAFPIEKVANQLRQIETLNFPPPLKIKTLFKEVDSMVVSLDNMTNALKGFRKYVPINLVKKLIAQNEIKIGGDKFQITILFCDLCKFSGISEKMTPEKVLMYLSKFFEEMVNVIFHTEGTVDKYIGDCIMAFWGAPIPQPDHAERACRSALRSIESFKLINPNLKKMDLPELKMGIGIATGYAVVGNLGSSDRLQYTAIGDNVNLASRLEELSKIYQVPILISEETYQQVKHLFVTRPVDKVIVHGKNEAAKIYELLDAFDDRSKKN